MKGKRLLIALIVVSSVCLMSCGITLGENAKKIGREQEAEEGEGKEYYENTDLEKFETFTSVTGIELNTQSEDDSTNIYNCTKPLARRLV